MKNVIFDMDGVLFDTEALSFRYWLEIAAEYGLPDMEKVYPLLIGKNRTDEHAFLVRRYGDAYPIYEMIDAVCDRIEHQIVTSGPPMKPFVREILSALCAQGAHLALASSTASDVVRKELAAAGLDGYFDAILGGDTVKAGKPAPDIFLAACRALGSQPADTYIIEDSENGIRAAYATGAKPIMVPDMLAPTDEMREKCFRIFPDLDKVREFLRDAE